MSSEITIVENRPIILHMGPLLAHLSDEQFLEFCAINRDLRIERTEHGDLVIMPPTSGEAGRRNSVLNMLLGMWCERDGSGIAFDSSTGFRLPNGAVRSPDAAWLRRTRWDRLAEQQRDEFLPLAPDFVVELRSKTDTVADVREKMREYIRNGVPLGWLIEPYGRWVEIYRPGQDPVLLDQPATLSGDPDLPGFVLTCSGFGSVVHVKLRSRRSCLEDVVPPS